ncbi:MAG: sulfurtransferase TusA family protein [Desulfobaccales bacterium]|jgi:TusA-related sulfurtransferase
MFPIDLKGKVTFFDLTNEVCPMTFVRAELHLERIPPGHRLGFVLKEGEASRDVPRSLMKDGHLVECVRQEGGDHWFIVTKAGGPPTP